jgi:phosphoglycolate phosphatase
MIGILFDLGGTLLDTLQDLADSTNAALLAFGYPPRSVEQVRRFVGNGALRLMQLAVPEGKDPEPVLKCFREHYQRNCQNRTAPYAGVLSMLEAVAREFPVAIVSNKPDSAVKALCARYFPGIYALGEGEGCPRKPAPDMVLRAMEALGVSRCMYVGDSEVDVATAQNAKVPCISVLWGFREKEELLAAGAGTFCPTPEQLPEIIREEMRKLEWQMNSSL